ncbi:uncharacterized protein Dana_GF17868 [Drosophila ananassae]|uniref:Chitin-binding type-2 domain-containing protein n=1 Tax=Drosophila ananassae TaxID=7217 RepID=B3M1V2_DROAN|nr:peritrophin-55 [Drosophila ananassae]EDV42212.1 uncharacterized protein Dana_GF17868 [Drosophila ananassae]
MKTVILVLAAFVAVNAQQCDRTPIYTQEISPVVCPAAGLSLPIYTNPQAYYKCTTVAGRISPIATNCTNNNYFSYPLQGCQPCNSYLPTGPCSSLAFGPTCVDINTADDPTTIAPTTTTVAPTTTTSADTTTTTTTTTTAAPTTTTPSVPTPPSESDTTATPSGSDDVITPSGTTISVPQPPSPNDSNVPTPNTPIPTAPIIIDSPPTVTEAPTAKSTL